MSGHFIDVDGRKIFLRARGNGAPVVLLHGFPQTGEVWNAVADKLAGRNRVLIPDLPGFGQSDVAASADGGDVASMLLGALEAEGIEKFALVGHDFGGSVAIRMALDAPERVERLVIVNAPFRSIDVTRSAHMLLFNIPILPELAFRLLGKQLVPLMIRSVSKNKAGLDAEAMQRYAESLAEPGKAGSALAYYRTMTRTILKRQLSSLPGRLPFVHAPEPSGKSPRRIEVPTLIVWGESDWILPVSLIESIERDTDNATVVRLPGVGHFVPDEAPSELAHEIDQFLSS